jgi:transposase
VPNRYEPGVQRTYEELARHYGTTIFPARAGRARDKAKVEAGVLIAQRWILARLRHRTFFSLEALNEAIAELLEDLNRRVMKVYRASRLELFERLDRPALKPLPTEPFVYAEWKTARVNIDYHVEVERHYYSVPHSQGYRSCLGILRLAKRYGDARLEAACGRALAVGARSYRHVDSILKNGLDRVPAEPDAEATDAAPVVHENVRGKTYYH